MLRAQGVLEEKFVPLALLGRGRLVLALRFWLWRVQAWQHQPSWSHTPDNVPPTPDQYTSLHELCAALRMSDSDLLTSTNYLKVVSTCHQQWRL